MRPNGRIILTALSLCLLLSGCATSPLQRGYTPQIEQFTEPTLGEVNTVEVGASMISSGTKKTYRTLVVSEPVTINATNSGMSTSYEIPPGEYIKLGETAVGDAYSVITRDSAKRITQSVFAEPFYALLDGLSNGNICIITFRSTKFCSPTTAVKSGHFNLKVPDAFQQTLLYNGKTGTQITLGYREFREDMARPAFSNDPVYDLSESKVIGYRGARIEIIKATNSSITYKVLNGFKN